MHIDGIFNVNIKGEKDDNIKGFKTCLYEIHLIRLYFKYQLFLIR